MFNHFFINLSYCLEKTDFQRIASLFAKWVSKLPLGTTFFNSRKFIEKNFLIQHSQ